MDYRENNIDIYNLSCKNKLILSSTSINMMFIFIFFIISGVNKDFNDVNMNYCYNITNITDEYKNPQNITDVVCFCQDTINLLNSFRYSYNIIGILCMLLIYVIIRRNDCLRITFMFIMLYILINFLMGNIIEYHLGGYDSFCYHGLYNYNSKLLMNYIINFWIINFILIIGVISLFIYCCKYFFCNNYTNHLRILITTPNNIQETLPIYQERDTNLPSYQESMNSNYNTNTNNTNNTNTNNTDTNTNTNNTNNTNNVNTVNYNDDNDNRLPAYY
jgi:hypothetical protein